MIWHKRVKQTEVNVRALYRYKEESLPFTGNGFEGKKPFTVNSGEIAVWFDEPGGGIQFKLPKSVSKLLYEGVLEKVV